MRDLHQRQHGTTAMGQRRAPGQREDMHRRRERGRAKPSQVLFEPQWKKHKGSHRLMVDSCAGASVFLRGYDSSAVSDSSVLVAARVQALPGLTEVISGFWHT